MNSLKNLFSGFVNKELHQKKTYILGINEYKLFDEKSNAECTVAGVEQCIALSITDGKKTLVVHVYKSANKDELSQLIHQNFNNSNAELKVTMIGGSLDHANDFVYKDGDIYKNGEIFKVYEQDNFQKYQDMDDIRRNNMTFQLKPPLDFSKMNAPASSSMAINGLSNRAAYKSAIEERIAAEKPLLAFNEMEYRTYSIPVNDGAQSMLFYNSEKVKKVLNELQNKNGMKFKLETDLAIRDEKNIIFDIKNGQIKGATEEKIAFNRHLLRKQVPRRAVTIGDTPPSVRKYMVNWNNEKATRKQLEKQGQTLFEANEVGLEMS